MQLNQGEAMGNATHNLAEWTQWIKLNTAGQKRLSGHSEQN
jgi:hypothetical protein